MSVVSEIDHILLGHAQKLKKALEHLRYSHKKVRRLPADSAKLDEEQLETWESFSARFARVVDLFLTKYLRSRILKDDPGFEGTLRDFVNQAEKHGLIASADRWMAIRELRNITAHEYTDADLTDYFKKSRKLADEVLRIEKILTKTPKR
jgi:hypothetical protein